MRTATLILCLAIFCSIGHAQGIKISALPSASALTGAELIPLNQGTTTKKATVNQLSTFIGGGGSSFNADSVVKYAWSLTGNSGTTAGTNFIGTTDNQDVIFKRNAVIAGYISDPSTAFGITALRNYGGEGGANCAFGKGSIGDIAFTGNSNSGFGNGTLSTLTTGNYNSAFGNSAGMTVATGNNNTCIGTSADVATDSTTNAIALGYQAVAKTNQFALASTITSVKLGTLPEYADDAAAGVGGLAAGELYQTTTGGSSFVKIKQ